MAFSDLSNEEIENRKSILRGKRYEEAFHTITKRNWWDNDAIINDAERFKFLYETYFEYYDLLRIEEIKEIKTEEHPHILHALRVQLEKELQKVKERMYVVSEE